MLDVPIINLSGDDAPVNRHYLSNLVNLGYTSAPDAFEVIQRHLRGDKFISAARPDLIKQLSKYLDDGGSENMSASKIMDTFEEYSRQRFTAVSPEIDLRTIMWLKDETQSREFGAQKFNATLKDIKRIVTNMQSALGRFRSVRITPVADMMYLIEA